MKELEFDLRSVQPESGPLIIEPHGLVGVFLCVSKHGKFSYTFFLLSKKIHLE